MIQFTSVVESFSQGFRSTFATLLRGKIVLRRRLCRNLTCHHHGSSKVRLASATNHKNDPMSTTGGTFYDALSFRLGYMPNVPSTC